MSSKTPKGIGLGTNHFLDEFHAIDQQVDLLRGHLMATESYILFIAIYLYIYILLITLFCRYIYECVCNLF